MDRTPVAPYREEWTVEKWDAGRFPADGPPDAIVTLSRWCEPTGEEIVDPARIAELEAIVAERERA